MNNPFENIDARLASLENSLNEILERLPRQRRNLLDAQGTESLYVSKRQAAAMLGVSEGTIHNLCRDGKLKRHYVGKALRLERSQIIALIEKSERRR
jgi:excisionase family DNA binding protein